MSAITHPRPLRAPRGPERTCKGWIQEAALRMLLNNLDPEVAEDPDHLVVYGGSGKAARTWRDFDAIVATLRKLENDETLLVQSGKPVGVLRTHELAPRILIANSLLVPKWATWEEFRRLEAMGLTMYGQMTAGSWIYIGTQGILQGTYETFAACARRHFGGGEGGATPPLQGRLLVTGGLGGMGGAQPLAATMNGAAFLGVEVNPERIERRLRGGYLDRMSRDLDEALGWLDEARRNKAPLSVGLLGNAAAVLPELVRRGITPDVLTDQTSAHDALNGYVPLQKSPDEALDALRRDDPAEYIRRAKESMAVHVRAMLELQRRGAVTFDYGNNLRAQAAEAGVADAFRIPGFIPEYIRPLFCEGKGPFRWAALSGDPADIYRTDEAVLEAFPEDEGLARWIRLRARAGEVSGAAGPHLLARLRRTRPHRPALQRHGAARRAEGSDRHRPRSPRCGIGCVAEPRDGGHEGRLRRDRRLADPQRPGQHGLRRGLGQRPPWRRRRHRLQPARRHGGRGRRQRGRGRSAATGADRRPGDRGDAARGRGV